jgi:hypothetical protein
MHLDEKTEFIAHFLEFCTLPDGIGELSLSSDEMEFLSSQCSIRFKESKSGFICYFSTQPGKQGIGSSSFTAFCFMLRSMDFKIIKGMALSEQLQLHFQKK